jgi:hypothetical protein
LFTTPNHPSSSLYYHSPLHPYRPYQQGDWSIGKSQLLLPSLFTLQAFPFLKSWSHYTTDPRPPPRSLPTSAFQINLFLALFEQLEIHTSNSSSLPPHSKTFLIG